eukprot:TRINITY_DN4382_c0_g1_i2.p1 TRINITY_DN4382_c0_g1~~TRINITY_DN4382_c0_g1_i2.p1  ORF type:complete len:125 (-),score=16.07 TRINITY_DN4382_c0_g1_i2:92-466(-)
MTERCDFCSKPVYHAEMRRMEGKVYHSSCHHKVAKQRKEVERQTGLYGARNEYPSASPTNTAAPVSIPSTSGGSKSCSACGRSGQGRFCEHCGGAMVAAPTGCSGCGANIVPGSKFCGNCGTRI